MFSPWPKLKQHKEQHRLWVCPKRFVYVPCGRQSGKTELALRKLVLVLEKPKPWPDPKYFYCGPTYGQAKRTAWQRLINLIPPQWIKDISRSELVITTVFGSELYLLGLDKPQRAEGMIFDGGVIDECSDIKPKTFDLSILPTLIWRDGWTWFIGVPKRFGAGAVEYRERYEEAIAGTLKDSAGFNWPSEGIVPQDTLDLYRGRMDERDFDEQFNAKWINASGGIFHAFDKEYNVRPVFYDTNLPIAVAQDFNVNPMAWVLGHIKGETFEIFDEIWLRDTNTPEALLVLLDRYGRHKGGFLFYGDASSQGRRTSAYQTDYAHIANSGELKRLGMSMHYDTSNPPRADRYAETNARICDGNGLRWIFIDPKCEHLIYDLKTRVYKPGTREADDSDKDSGHPTDALGYLCHKRWPLRLTPISDPGIVIIEGTT